MKVLLIYPPFAMPDKPYISIPVLTSYLKSKNIQVHAVDANIEFYRRFLSGENIGKSEKYAVNRLRKLNGKSELNLPEMIEYARLILILSEAEGTINDMKLLFSSGIVSSHKKIQLFRRAIQLASIPFFPEWLEFTDTTGYVRYRSGFKKFSSRHILESLRNKTLFSGILEDILFSNLRWASPPVVGISVVFPDQILPAFKCAQVIKKIYPETHVTLGGPFVSCHMRELRELRVFEIVDSFIIDAGEVPLEKLVKEVSMPEPDLSRVPGLVYLRHGKIRKNPPQIPPKLDSLPPPDYTVFPLDEYLVGRERMAILFRLSRGCYWGKCTFCSSELPMIKHYDRLSSELAYQHLKTVVEQTGVRVIYFSDDAAPLTVLDHISRRMIEDNLGIKWAVNLRFDNRMTLQRMMLFQKSGCFSVFLGMESFSERTLKLMRKGISIGAVDGVLSNIVWSGINASLYMIVGFPTEKEEEALYSFGRIKEFIDKGLIKNCIYNIFEISPYSPVSINPEKFGISSIIKPEDEDLIPPISDFESSGMSRRKASELLGTFLSQLRKKSGSDKKIPRQMFVGSEPLHLNFDLSGIKSSVEKVSSCQKGNVFLPELMERFSDTVKVFRNS